MLSRRLLITGTPRSGTVYMSHLLGMFFGLDCPHEHLGTDGTVSSLYCVADSADYFGKHDTDPPAHEVQFGRIVRLVRNPIANIHSMQNELSPTFWEWQERHTGLPIVPEDRAKNWIPNLDQVAEFYCAWHALIPKMAFILPLEQITGLLGPRNQATSRRRRSGEISPEQLDAVKETATAFGYY